MTLLGALGAFFRILVILYEFWSNFGRILNGFCDEKVRNDLSRVALLKGGIPRWPSQAKPSQAKPSRRAPLGPPRRTSPLYILKETSQNHPAEQQQEEDPSKLCLGPTQRAQGQNKPFGRHPLTLTLNVGVYLECSSLQCTPYKKKRFKKLRHRFENHPI